MRIVIRIANKELAREFLQSFLPVLEPIGPRSIELRVAAVTRLRRVTGYRIPQVGRQTHVLRQLPNHTRPQAIGTIDASCLFVCRTLAAQVKIEIKFRRRGNADSARMDQHVLIGMLAPFLLIVLKRAIDVVAPVNFFTCQSAVNV